MVTELIRVADALANSLGCAVAAMEDQTPFSDFEADVVRTEILRWHRIRALVQGG